MTGKYIATIDGKPAVLSWFGAPRGGMLCSAGHEVTVFDSIREVRMAIRRSQREGGGANLTYGYRQLLTLKESEAAQWRPS